MPIPKEAKKVFEGVIFDVYQWEQKLFNGKTATFEMLDRHNSVVIIPVQGETVYYAHQEQPGRPPFISLFGGQVDAGEESIEAAKRELLEEAGMQSDDWEHIHTFNPAPKIDWTIDYYVARNVMKVGNQNLDDGEKIEIHETTIDQFTDVMIKNNVIEQELLIKLMRMELGYEDKAAFLARLRQ